MQPMEISPPWLLSSQQTVCAELWRARRDVRSVSVDRECAERRRRRSPGAPSDANDGERGAGEPDLDVGAQDEAEQAEEERHDRVVGFLNRLTALDGPGRAGRRRRLAGRLGLRGYGAGK